MLQGVAFDMDGTLLDTMPIWNKAIVEVFASAGLPYGPEVFERIMVTTIADVAEEERKALGLAVTVDEILAPLTPTFLRMVQATQVQKKEGADALLDALSAAGVPFTLATSLPRDIMELLLTSVGWEKRFPLIVCGDDVENDKPAPDIFIEAAHRLGCETGNCVAFEDAPKGVASAKSAGMKVIGIHDPRFGFNLTAADRLVESYNQTSVDDLKNLLS